MFYTKVKEFLLDLTDVAAAYYKRQSTATPQCSGVVSEGSSGACMEHVAPSSERSFLRLK